MNGGNFEVNNVWCDLCERTRCATDGRHRSVKSRGSALEMRGVVVPARDFIYFLFQLTKNADSYAIHGFRGQDH